MTVQSKWTNDPELKDLLQSVSERGSVLFTEDVEDTDQGIAGEWLAGDKGLTPASEEEVATRILEFQTDDLAQVIRQYVGYAMLERDPRNRVVDRGKDDPRNAPKWRLLYPIVEAMVKAFSSNGKDETHGLLSALQISRRLAPGARIENLIAGLYCNAGQPIQAMAHARNAIDAATTPDYAATGWTWLSVSQRLAGVGCPVTSAHEAVKACPEYLFPWVELLRAGCFAEDIDAVKTAVESMLSHPQMCSDESFDKPATSPDLSFLPVDILEAIPMGLQRFIESESCNGSKDAGGQA